MLFECFCKGYTLCKIQIRACSDKGGGIGGWFLRTKETSGCVEDCEKSEFAARWLRTLLARVSDRFVTGVRRMRDRGRDDGQWLVRLHGVTVQLDDLNKSTEDEFLAIGERLLKFNMSAREISRISSSVAGLMAGEEITGAIGGFHGIVQHMERLEGESRESAGILNHVLRILDQMFAHLAGFKQTARVLRVLCVSTRIESARLGQRDIGFSVLAGDVDKLASEIETKCTHLLDHSHALGELIRRTLSRVLDLEARQHGQAQVVLEKTLLSLGSLTEKHSASSAGLQRVSARYNAISQSIGEIVSSLQFHDITRQRIEHSRSALDILNRGELTVEGNGVGGEVLGGGLNQLRLAGDVCELQKAQLNHARDELVFAVENIMRNLRHIADNVAEIAEETQVMVGSADELGHSFLSEIETGFSSVMKALEGYGEAGRELSVAMESVGETLNDMAHYAGDIEGIGTKIKLIALNAIVKSCHMGEEGASLGVLAEAIHRLSVETCERTVTVCDSFKSIIEAAETLNAGMNSEGQGRTGEVGRLSGMLEDLMAKLRKVNGDIFSLLTRMNEEGRVLSNEIEGTVSRMEVHEHVDGAIREAVVHLDAVTALSRKLIPVGSQSDREEYLKSLQASYTMQGERDVHRTVTAGAAVSLMSEPLVRPEMGASTLLNSTDANGVVEMKLEKDGNAEEEEDLGDNVELF